MAKRSRKPWYQKIGRTLRSQIDAEIDLGMRSSAEIYAEWKLNRFARLSTFQAYMTRRRRYISRLGARVRGRAASGLLYAFGMPLSVARRHGIKADTACEQCGRPASHAVVYSTGRCQVFCRADFGEFIGGLVTGWKVGSESVEKRIDGELQARDAAGAGTRAARCK